MKRLLALLKNIIYAPISTFYNTNWCYSKDMIFFNKRPDTTYEKWGFKAFQ